MRIVFIALAFTAAFLPIYALAAGADLPAGFAPNSIWVSRTQITAGDSINIFTVIYNSSDAPLEGAVGFTVDGRPVGTRNFSVKAGETQTESVPWTASAGTHSVFARIEKISNADTSASASILNRTTDTITISVAEPPPPTPSAQAISSVASAIKTVVASSTPIVISATQKLYGITEDARKGAVGALEKQLAQKAGDANTKGEVPGASASSSATSLGSFISSAWDSILRALLFVCRISVLFYALLAFVIFMLFQLLRAMFRERSTL
ncbi:hypothetical protein A3F27_00690 [Candidatus Kaiserbacteria bacterium RIFCSPHIGHO2_12_FULL_53_13]|uniref:CARDB domain-containing protein n=1 Tax=Candidatus Kaiserbacteria bacterium RIFCSPHIGHO2_12_FULL_53_13 TaxID=1798502 RepID=A0A1F6ECK5_9BACT|nr:MAG: hypothetical protein A3F27_00690 [Candidatus Kaiserbacteria bacterium RIFCSPHIGHO2_12_FULL_53_13]OGG74593.1 MAG: hypothetical protein A3A37_00830 [Candidatus Kaiserbacteria bacterium RIFCSPLOWO2_01_FULL_52_36]